MMEMRRSDNGLGATKGSRPSNPEQSSSIIIFCSPDGIVSSLAIGNRPSISDIFPKNAWA
jgi:hypothetical protein